MNTPLISVIVPIKNAESTIEKCLDSLLEQSYKNIEILLIDNNSSDETPLIIDKYAMKDSRIRILFEKQGGVSSARNAGIKKCRGQYITFVDADDYLEKNAIEEEVTVIKERKIDILYFDFYIEKKESIKTCDNDKSYGIYEKNNKKQLLIDMCTGEFFSTVWRGIYASKLIKDRVFFRPIKFAEDLLFNIDCINVANAILVNNLVLYHYVDNEESSLKKIQYDLQNTIDYLDQFDCLVGESNNIDLQDVYIQSLNVCCLRILNTSIQYKEFKKWFSKIKLTNMMDNKDKMVKYIINRSYVRAFIVLWKRKIVKKIKRG